MSYYYFATAAFTVLGLLLWRWRLSRKSISYLPGPPSGSWLVGNLPSLVRPEYAFEANFEWTKKYGNGFRYKGCFGENILYLSDPKALQYILNTSAYNFPKAWEVLVRGRLTTGDGIIVAEGERHARHRRVMNPSFSHSALRGFLPLFLDISRRTTTAWKAEIHRRNARTSVLPVSSLLARTTLDAIGEAAFGYKFNAIDEGGPKTELEKTYRNLLFDVHYKLSDFSIAFRRLLGYAPLWMSNILASLPMKDLRRLNNCMSVAHGVAKGLMKKEEDAHANGKVGGKDVMSILVKANFAEDPRRRLQESEILPQITTLLFAGHETTASTLSWTLYELSRHPEVQQKLREEINAIVSDVTARGNSEMTISDLDSMKYMGAVMKETLRCYPIIGQMARRAGRDDVIPLETPLYTISGDTITAIPVRKGQVIQLGVCSYNRLTELWGQDAYQWRPERFLKDLPSSHKINIGVIGNLATFSSGLRGCIGWRFSLIEMQIVLINLIHNFEFSPAPNVDIKCAFSGILQPMVKGQESKGTQLPLTVSIISDSGTV